MPKVGSLGLDMMFRTCTVQVRNKAELSFMACYYYLYSSYDAFSNLHTSSFWDALSGLFLLRFIQVNLDFDSEADMIRKFRAGLALQPVSLHLFSRNYLIVGSNLFIKQIATALFANSPFTEGKPNGYLSMRR